MTYPQLGVHPRSRILEDSIIPINSIEGNFVVCPCPGWLVPSTITLTNPNHAWKVQSAQKTLDAIDQTTVTTRNSCYPAPEKKENISLYCDFNI